MKDKLRDLCHQIQTPLTVVQGFLRISEKELLTAETKEMLEVSKASLSKIKALLDELQQLAKT